MKYAIVILKEVTPRLLAKSGATSLSDLRKNKDETKCVIMVNEKNKWDLEKYPKYSHEEIGYLMKQREWTGDSWISSLFK